MNPKWLAALTLGLVVLATVWAYAQGPMDKATRDKALAAMQAGNWKDAYDGFRKLALLPGDDPALVGSNLHNGIQCLQNLGRRTRSTSSSKASSRPTARTGALRRPRPRATVASSTTASSWPASSSAAIAGAGKYVNGFERDRIRALQLMEQALPLAEADKNKDAAAQFCFHFANMLLSANGQHESWRLQYLTDLKQLPDYEEGNQYGWRGYGRRRDKGAPVDADGKPVYHQTPEDLGGRQDRRRALALVLEQAVELNPQPRRRSADLTLRRLPARSQFGVQTMAHYGWLFGRMETDDTKKNESGTYALHTLGEDETIARLATGIKRFKLPDEFNYIKIYQQIADRAADRLRRSGPATRWPRSSRTAGSTPRRPTTGSRPSKEYGPRQQQRTPAGASTRSSATGAASSRSMTQPAGTGRHGRVSASATASKVELRRPTRSTSTSCSTT